MLSQYVAVSEPAKELIQEALTQLLAEPVPAFGTLGIEVVMHQGVARRVRIKTDNQIELTDEQNGNSISKRRTA
jgi:hypothetical protein